MPGVVLSEEIKAKCRHHMGYLQVDEASTYTLGYPAPVQTQFQIEGAFSRIMPSAIPQLVLLLKRLDNLECGIDEDSDDLAVSKIDTIEMRPDEFEQRIKRYMYWRAALGNLLGVPPNQNDQRFADGALGDALNIPVIN